MTALTEGMHAGEFIVSEANGTRSRETKTLVSGQDLEAGTVVAAITATGKLSQFDQDNGVAGTNAAVGVLIYGVDASGGDQPCVIVARDAEVNGNELTWPSDIETAEQATAVAQLAALGIIVR